MFWIALKIFKMHFSQANKNCPAALPRGAESQTWVRGQLKYYVSAVLWTPKQTGKMPQFCPDFHVISKKKDLHGKIPKFCTDFDVIPPTPPKKRSSVFHIVISQCHLNRPSAGPPEANGPHHGPRGHCSPLPPSRRPWLYPLSVM